MPLPTFLETKFPLGQIVCTTGIQRLLECASVYPPLIQDCLRRHANADWGDLDSEDKYTNNLALANNTRILSAYILTTESKYSIRIWIITEHDRSVTTILLPSEY